MPIDPIRNPAAFSDIRFGGKPVPGKILDIRGLRDAIEWTTTRAIAGSGWVQVCRGRVPVDSIDIDISLDGFTDDQRSAAWRALFPWIVFVRGAPPPRPIKPPTLEVTGAPFKAAGVLKVVYKELGQAIYRTNAKNVVTVSFKEAASSTPFPPETPEPAILSDTNPTPKTFAEATLAGAAATSFGDAPSAPTGSDMQARYPGSGAWGTPQ